MCFMHVLLFFSSEARGKNWPNVVRCRKHVMAAIFMKNVYRHAGYVQRASLNALAIHSVIWWPTRFCWNLSINIFTLPTASPECVFGHWHCPICFSIQTPHIFAWMLKDRVFRLLGQGFVYEVVDPSRALCYIKNQPWQRFNRAHFWQKAPLKKYVWCRLVFFCHNKINKSCEWT